MLPIEKESMFCFLSSGSGKHISNAPKLNGCSTVGLSTGSRKRKKPSKTCVWELLVTDAREVKLEVNDLKFPLAFVWFRDGFYFWKSAFVKQVQCYLGNCSSILAYLSSPSPAALLMLLPWFAGICCPERLPYLAYSLTYCHVWLPAHALRSVYQYNSRERQTGESNCGPWWWIACDARSKCWLA